MQRIEDDVRQFFDLEASVDEEELDGTDDEAENDLLMEFLDDESIGSHDESPEQVQSQTEEQKNSSNVFWQDYLERARMRGGANRNQVEMESHVIECFLPFAFVEMPGDYPLWKIACRPGLEYEAMISLFGTTDDRHDVRSIVTKDSMKGFIYIEATMNPALIQLLKITPGIITTKAGIKKKGISCSEVVDLLRMEDESSRFRKGDWVNIQQGLYKGDVGLVTGMEDWWVEVLLVPRLKHKKSNPQKRKRSTVRPAPDLFDPSRHPAKKGDDNCYRVGSVYIEHSLCKKIFDFTAVDKNVQSITYPLFKRFLSSQHPTVLDTNMPRPTEWHFEIDNKVEVLPAGTPARISAMYPSYLEVNLIFQDNTMDDIYEDLRRVLWKDIRKILNVGDYVRVTGGPDLGQCGFVVRVEKSEAALSLTELKKDDGAPYRIMEIIVPINCLQLTTPPHRCADVRKSGNPHVGRNRPHPWIGRNVVITKNNHPSRGRVGRVVEAIRCDREGGESFKFHVEFGTVIRQGLPFERIVISEEDVQEYAEMTKFEQALTTETYTSSSSSHHTTPMVPVSHHASTSSQPEPEHVLLRRCFEGLEVKAHVKGGLFTSRKEKLVEIFKINDRLRLRTKNQRTVVAVEPSWVTVIHPNAKGDNNLLIFVNGDHLGKFCRRIHHRDNMSGPVSIRVAIVERHLNSSDTLTGEEVEAPMDQFAIVLETSAEKDNKNQLMDALRKRSRGKSD